jgi:MFS family permease
VVVNVAVGRGYPSALRARVYAALSTAWIMPAVIGPVVAGAVAEHLSWRIVFLAVVPLTLVAAAIAVPAVVHTDHRLERDHRPQRDRTEDTTGLVRGLALAGGTTLFIAGLATRQPVLALLLVVAGLALAVPALVGVLRSSAHLTDPDDTAARRRARTGAVVVSGLFAMAFFGVESFLPLSLVSLHGRTATEAGLALTTAAITWTVASWAQARWQAPMGPRRLVRMGLAFVALGIAIVVTLDWSSTPWWLAFLGWGVGGFGMGLAYATSSVVVLDNSPLDEQGGPVAAQQVLITLGVALGAGLGGAAVSWSAVAGAGRAPGLRVFDLVSVGVALAGIAVAGMLPRRSGPGDAGAPKVATAGSHLGSHPGSHSGSHPGSHGGSHPGWPPGPVS